MLCTAIFRSKTSIKIGYACRSYDVSLYVKPHCKNKKICYEKWHNIKDLQGFFKNKSTKYNRIQNKSAKSDWKQIHSSLKKKDRGADILVVHCIWWSP